MVLIDLNRLKMNNNESLFVVPARIDTTIVVNDRRGVLRKDWFGNFVLKSFLRILGIIDGGTIDSQCVYFVTTFKTPFVLTLPTPFSFAELIHIYLLVGWGE